MKKAFVVLALAVALFASCEKADVIVPTAEEQAMVTEQMTWRLDSIKVITNYAMVSQETVVYREEDGIDIVDYTFYPYTYKFPESLYFISDYDGSKVSLSEYKDDYCKFLLTTPSGDLLAGGYLCYYRNLFTFSGAKNGAWAVFFITEATANWDTEVWTIAYNPVEAEDGRILERRIEFYHRVK
ncbi:MAG: hypothetical protein IKX71_05245 [Bacteroidales bacterium]|nr:hypothetical protein [Bacteroidales bacterium]